MNRLQKIALWAGVLALSALLLCPPVGKTLTLGWADGSYRVLPAGFRPLFLFRTADFDAPKEPWQYHVDGPRLGLGAALISLLTGAMVLALGGSTRSRSRKPHLSGRDLDRRIVERYDPERVYEDYPARPPQAPPSSGSEP